MHSSSMGEYARRCREPHGPFHDFWLFQEGTRAHADYQDLLSRKDAPVRMSDDVLQYLLECLSSMPTENPACRCEPGVGLNVYGPTVISASGGSRLHDALSAWIDKFPESLEMVDLEYAASSHGVDAVEGELISRRQGGVPADPWTAGAHLSADLADCATDGGEVFIEVIRVPRAVLAEQIRTLAEYGRLAAEGTHFVLHVGI